MLNGPELGPAVAESRTTADELPEFICSRADPATVKAAFEREGYIIVRNAVPRPLCERAKEAFIEDVLPSRLFFKRHATAPLDRHTLSDEGFMRFPIMNIQDLGARGFRRFREAGLAVLTHPNVRRMMDTLFGEPGKVIHTMYFDANQATWAHRDSNYIDSAEVGRMIGVWVAVEDIHPGAGRFYVHARSHKAKPPAQWRLDKLDPNGKEYKDRMVDFVRSDPDLPRIAPTLRQGDAILFSSLTVHGSLDTEVPGYSRRNLTAHYIPTSQHFMWLRRREGSRRTVKFEGTEVVLHGDLTRWSVQLPALGRHFARTWFPRWYERRQQRRASRRA